jgi:Raf kinase inhibitor-like YbhB/YbcL family protein
MRRRRTAFLALAAATALAACDTDDGRQMQTPDSFARFQLQSTTPSTTSTVAPPPTELTVAPTTPAPSSTSAPATTSNASTTAVAATTRAADAATTTAANAASTTAAGAAGGPRADRADPAMRFAGPWDDGAAIPARFTCDGAGAAPRVTWTRPPAGTAELAMAVTDADADGFVHWLVVELTAQAGSLGGRQPTAVGAEALNSFGDPGWGGPCPPPGDGPHTYVFTLHLLDQQLELPADTPTDVLLDALEAATAGTATFTGTYERA